MSIAGGEVCHPPVAHQHVGAKVNDALAAAGMCVGPCCAADGRFREAVHCQSPSPRGRHAALSGNEGGQQDIKVAVGMCRLLMTCTAASLVESDSLVLLLRLFDPSLSMCAHWKLVERKGIMTGWVQVNTLQGGGMCQQLPLHCAQQMAQSLCQCACSLQQDNCLQYTCHLTLNDIPEMLW